MDGVYANSDSHVKEMSLTILFESVTENIIIKNLNKKKY